MSERALLFAFEYPDLLRARLHFSISSNDFEAELRSHPTCVFAVK